MGVGVLCLGAMKRTIGNPFRCLLRRRLAAAVMVAALLVMALIPAGFMPSFGADGKVAIVICSGMGEKTVFVDADDAPAGTHQDTEACPYFLAQSPTTMDAPVLFIDTPIYHIVSTFSHDDAFVGGVRILSPPARGPPAVTSA